MENNKEYQEHLEKVKENGYYLAYVPEELRTKELCEMAVNSRGYALAFVPIEMRTEELCEKAVQKSGRALAYVPKEFKEELAEKYDIDLPKKPDERGR